MSVACDIAVLGAGPAGMAAATEAARRGARVVLLDEYPAPGGQAHRAAPPGFRMPADSDRRAGDRLRHALALSGAELRLGHRVWDLAGGPPAQAGISRPFRIASLGPQGPAALEARALILCPGAQERIIPFPGWTLPGVIGLAAASILLKAQGVLPGRRAVVAGVGPLLLAVAARVMKAGAELAAVVDLAGPAEWQAALPALASRPDLLMRGLAWRARLASRSVAVLRAHRVLAAEGGRVLERVRVAPLSGGAPEEFDCDALCIGHGLVPATEAARCLGAAHCYAPRDGGWVPVLDKDGRSSVPLLYVAGDAGSLRGAAAAPASGRLAALAALADLGRLPPRRHARARLGPALAHAHAVRPGAAMAAMMALRPALLDGIAPETVVCRCEGVTRRDIEQAIGAGAREMNQLGRFTRCGTGPCQGRLCGEAAAELLAGRVGGRERAGFLTTHPPLRPVPIEMLLGEPAPADTAPVLAPA